MFKRGPGSGNTLKRADVETPDIDHRRGSSIAPPAGVRAPHTRAPAAVVAARDRDRTRFRAEIAATTTCGPSRGGAL